MELEGLGLTPRTRRVLEAAAREAKKRDHGFLGTEHLLLGVFSEPEAIACRVLANLGVIEEARDRVVAIMESSDYMRPLDRYGMDPVESEGERVMPWLDPAVTDEERTARGLPTVAGLHAQIADENRRRAAEVALAEELPPGAESRRAWRPWTRSELLERREREGAACWRDGDTLVFVCQADADQVHLTGGLQCEMWRVEEDLWVVGYRLRQPERAFVSYAFVPDGDYAAAFAGGRMAVWHGPDAPEQPETAGDLRGELRHLQVPGSHLATPRGVHAYLSPGWRDSPRTLVVQAADAAHRAEVLEPLVLQGRLPPVVCLGVEFLSGLTGRADEYLPGQSMARFDAHMAFQADDLPAWTSEDLGLSPPPERRVVTGQSNGGTFAVWAGLRRPDVFGHVLAFSVAGDPPPAHLPEPGPRWAPASYQLVAGSLEPFRSGTSAWRDALERRGIRARHQELVAGHDPMLWDIAFLSCLQQLDG
jgi:predicted esterase